VTEKKWTKPKFRKYIYDKIGESLKEQGFKQGNSVVLYTYTAASSALKISSLDALGRIPGGITISFRCGVYIPEVSSLLNTILGGEGEREFPVFSFPIDVGIGAAHNVNYGFNWNNMQDANLKIDKIEKTIISLKKICDRITGVDSLKEDVLIKIPIINRICPGGLKFNADSPCYHLPETAIIGAKLDGKIHQAKEYIMKNASMPSGEKSLWMQWLEK